MNQDCRNDCVEPLSFPRKLFNRPGLSHIDYRIGTYSDFREVLFRNLNKDPVLAEWTYRREDDPGIALLEGTSILGDILTFYQELYANEAYLRTAKWRESISDLVRLLGYRLSPGLGGRATFAFEVTGNKPVVVPEGFLVKADVEGLEQPANFETDAETSAIPSLGRFFLYRPTHIPGFTDEVSSFSIETSSLLNAGLKIDKGDRMMLLDKDRTTNSQIVIVKDVEQQFDRTNIFIAGSWKGGKDLTSITAYKLGRTFRHFGHNAPLQVIELDAAGKPSQNNIKYDRKLHGITKTINPTNIEPLIAQKDIPLDSEVESMVVGSKIIIEGVYSGPYVTPGGVSNYGVAFTEVLQTPLNSVDLPVSALSDVAMDPTSPGTDGGSSRGSILRNVTIVREIISSKSSSLTWGVLSGTSTIVTIDSDMYFGPGQDSIDIRKLAIHETVGMALILENMRHIDHAVEFDRLDFYSDLDEYRQLNDRRLAVQKEDGTAAEIKVETQSAYALGDIGEKLRPLKLISPPGENFTLDDFPVDNPGVTVYGNLINSTQGKRDNAVLGNGDSREIFRTFKLPKSPMTYLNSPVDTPPEVPELQVYVNDRLWKRVPSFFGREGKEEIYIVREDSNDDSWVQFGDGKTGARLPSGIKNVVANYRTGTGAYGALKDDTSVQAQGKLDRLDKVQMIGISSGGSTPESGDNAREAAPGKIQSLDRLVSIRDFETEALSISGVSKVSASWEPENNIPTVKLTVLMETGRDKEVEDVRRTLTNYNKFRGPQRFPIKVVQGKLQYVYIDAVFAFHPAFREELVRKAIMEALGVAGEESTGPDGSRGLFLPGQRRFGQREYATKIEGTIQNVEGIVWAKVKAFGVLGEDANPEDLILPEHMVFTPFISCKSDQVLTLYKGHLFLNAAEGK